MTSEEMLGVKRIQFPVSIALPADWSDQLAAIALPHGLRVSDVEQNSSGAVLSLSPADPHRFSSEGFAAAVQEASEAIKAFLSPPAAPSPTFREELLAAKSRVASGDQPEITGRQLLKWFGAARRGARVVEWIRSELESSGLTTEPDFMEVWVDVPLRLRAKTDGAAKPVTTEKVGQDTAGAEVVDPVYRIGQLPAANQEVLSVAPGAPISEALTTMMLKEFSQLPVLRTERDCRGAISWQSVGRAIALGRPHATVDECLQRATEVPSDTNLFDVIPTIVREGFVLVKAKDRRIQGIVTVADLSLQFRDWTEPFLLLGQIENLLREIVRRSFSLEEIRAVKNPADQSRQVNEASDLTFGEYVRLLEPLAVWPKLGVSFHREPFLKDLRATQEIRNEVMHFNPDPLDSGQLTLLRNFASFLDLASSKSPIG